MMATYVKKINLAFFHKNVIGVMSIVVYVSQIGSACTLKCNRMKNRLEFCTKSTSFLIIILLLSMVHLCFTPSVILQLQNVSFNHKARQTNVNLFNSLFVLVKIERWHVRIQFAALRVDNVMPIIGGIRRYHVSSNNINKYE